MDRLKARQRVAKLNLPERQTQPLSYQVIAEEHDNGFDAHLAAKVRVNSIINNSIPDLAYDPVKIKSHITPAQLAEFQRKENEPIEIEGQIYRMHPATVPELELYQEKGVEITVDSVRQKIEEINAKIQESLHKIEVNQKFLNDVEAQRKRIHNKFDETLAKISLEERDVREKEKLIQKYLDKRDAEEARILESDAKSRENIAILERRIGELKLKREELPDMDRLLASKERNKQLLKEYQENLRVLNRNYDIPHQGPDETEKEYLDRIQSQIVYDPHLLQNRFNLHEGKVFRDNLKEIIRDPTVIEYAYNTLFQEDDSYIPEVNKFFEKIKTRYAKNYGTYQLNDQELVQFLRRTLKITDEAVVATPVDEKIEPTIPTNKAELIQYIKDSKVINVSTIFNNEKLTLIQGTKGGLNIDTDGVKKSLSQSNIPTLRVIYKAIADLGQPVVSHGEGFGIPQEKLPKICKLGKIDIDLHKLFYKNILSIRQNGYRLTGMNNAPVSDEFIKIVMDLCKGHFPTNKDLQKLPESTLFDSMLHLAGLHKKVEHTKDKTVQHLKDRMTLILGEHEAGNTNPALFKELQDIVFKLFYLGEITQNSAKDFLNQFKN